MDTIFMNSEYCNESYLHRLLFNLSGKINLRSDKYVALINPSMCYTLKNIKKSYKNKEFKILALT